MIMFVRLCYLVAFRPRHSARSPRAATTSISRVIPPMGTPVAPHLEFAGEIKREVGVPVMHASRINDVATARHAIRDGLLDLVGMTRAHIADPHIVAKIQAGEEDRIRPCVGASLCLDEIYQARDAKCIHNPATGREDRLPHHVAAATGTPRKAVVVGTRHRTGPGGRAARARGLGGVRWRPSRPARRRRGCCCW